MLTEENAFLVQGSVSSVLVVFAQSAQLRIIPYAIAAVPLIILDLIYGIKAARFLGNRIRFSTALRRTFTKIWTYICWLILATAMSLAFNAQWIEWVVLGTVYSNELASVVGNYLETKGIGLSLVSLIRVAARKGAGKAGIDVTKEEMDEIIQPRDSKGRFTKKKP